LIADARLDLAPQRLATAVEQRRRALAGEGFGGRLADAGRRAGDQNDLFGEATVRNATPIVSPSVIERPSPGRVRACST
jgi:hypothetical protein